MGQQITIPIDAHVTYERFITGQNNIPPINEKDDVVILDFTVPRTTRDGATAKIQWAEHGDEPKKRWLRINLDDGEPDREINDQISGTLNFTVNFAENPATNQMSVAPNAHVMVMVYMYDPETVPKHGDSWNDPRNMLFDWSTFA